MKSYRVLILEDDLETLETIFSVLQKIETAKDIAFAATVIPDYLQVEAFINQNPQINFDILLLDRDCFLAGSFHVVNLDLFDLDKVITISSVPSFNQEVQARGVKRSVPKDYSNLKDFGRRLELELLQIQID